jgi:hypothetical protein
MRLNWDNAELDFGGFAARASCGDAFPDGFEAAYFALNLPSGVEFGGPAFTERRAVVATGMQDGF